MTLTSSADPAGPAGAAEQSLDALVDRARELAGRGTRTILGITGAPGAGKSTLAAQLADALGPRLAVLVPMDGFHLAHAVLEHLDRVERKGAPDTFDAWGYAALLERIHAQHSTGTGDAAEIIYAPEFRRDLEEPVGSAIPVYGEIPLVITEGNYLLLEGEAWERARAVVHETWFLAPPEQQRLRWLVERHERFGRTPTEARERTLGSDQRNAELIARTAPRADRVVRLAG